MSKAYICDRCGAIMPSDVGTPHAIWTTNPFACASTVEPSMHLCDGCYEKLEREYLANLRGEDGK